MFRSASAVVAVVFAAVTVPAHGFVFSLTPVTNTTPNFAGAILIQGTVTVAPGETFFSPLTMSTVHLPFLPGFTAGFNGNGQTWDPGFLAWNGTGTYSGPIYNHMVSPNNLGYAGGMPLGLYGSNVLGPGGQSALILSYADANGLTQFSTQTYAVNVVPAPGAAVLLAVGGMAGIRRRR